MADLVFTDPPYNVAYRGKAGSIANDDLGSNFPAFLEAACRAMLPFAKGAAYVCMSSSEIGTLKAAFEAAGGHWSTFAAELGISRHSVYRLGSLSRPRQRSPVSVPRSIVTDAAVAPNTPIAPSPFSASAGSSFETDSSYLADSQHPFARGSPHRRG